MSRVVVDFFICVTQAQVLQGAKGRLHHKRMVQLTKLLLKA
jgi:hypothetical protein